MFINKNILFKPKRLDGIAKLSYYYFVERKQNVHIKKGNTKMRIAKNEKEIFRFGVRIEPEKKMKFKVKLMQEGKNITQFFTEKIENYLN